ncbi:hypothetical protein F183_A12740 [Bryobacterales bacterium F-183]|nr:hypothetical protein F183_A12740 [Bryobacterales bacterium F-183]
MKKHNLGASARGTVLRCALSLLAVAAAAKADSFLITFDAGDPIGGLAVNTVLSNQYAATTGATFSPNAFTGSGWATNTDMRIVSSTSLNAGILGGPALVSGNILRNFQGWLAENGNASFLITFANPIISFSADFAGVAPLSLIEIRAFNGSSLLGSVSLNGSATGQERLSLSGLGNITSVAVIPGNFFDWVGVDNIAFSTPTPTGVPEPSAAALWLGTGLATLAGLRHRRNR